VETVDNGDKIAEKPEKMAIEWCLHLKLSPQRLTLDVGYVISAKLRGEVYVLITTSRVLCLCAKCYLEKVQIELPYLIKPFQH